MRGSGDDQHQHERRRYVRKRDGAGDNLIEDIARHPEAGGAEEDPADQNKVEGRQSAQEARAARERQFRIAVQRQFHPRCAAKPTPCQAPHATNVQPAPCHSPPITMVITRLR